MVSFIVGLAAGMCLGRSYTDFKDDDALAGVVDLILGLALFLVAAGVIR